MANVESLSSSVVREYLSRKGLKDTLVTLDKEMPRMDGCIGNRAQLAKELGIKSLMKKNKETKQNFRTMLEVIVQYMLANPLQLNFVDSQSSIETSYSSSEQNSNILSPREKDSRIQKEESWSKETQKNSNVVNLKSSLRRNEFNTKDNSFLYGMDDGQELKKNSGISDPRPSSAHNRSLKSRPRTASREDLAPNKMTDSLDSEWDLGLNVEKSTLRDRTSRDILDIKTEKAIFSEESDSKDHILKPRRQGSLNKEDTLEQMLATTSTKSESVRNKEMQSRGQSTLLKKTSTQSSRRNAGSPSGAVMSTGLHNSRKNVRTRHFRESFEDDIDSRPYEGDLGSQNVSDSQKKQKEDVFLSDHKASSLATKQENMGDIPDWKKGIIQSKNSKKPDMQAHTSPATNKLSNEELIFEDVDDNLAEELDHLNKLDISRKPAISSAQGRSITLTTAKDLKTILFGSSSGTFNQEWRNQGFSFSDNEHLKYGIIQHKGGPCGLLASVQAVLLKHLLFGDDLMHSSSKKHLRFSVKETNNALCSALTEILWRAGSNKEAFVAMRSEKAQFLSSAGYKHDGLTEKLITYGFYDHEELESFVRENIHQLSSDQESGSILLLYSVILSRSIEKIKEDMDDPNGTLLGAHGYCTQDMVNLVLTGKAVSNTFDNVIELDAGGHTKNVLKGIEKQSDIGLLSLFEHYKSCLVGSNFKNPKFPIWVVCSESHFSVLFSLRRSVLNERRIQKRFDLYYYDGLARQDEEIRLTVDVTPEDHNSIITEDLTPPLEHCIRTRWKDAVIDWNGTEPLL